MFHDIPFSKIRKDYERERLLGFENIDMGSVNGTNRVYAVQVSCSFLFSKHH